MEEDRGETRMKLVSSDSAYGSSTADTDTEDAHTPTAITVPYNQDITHKVSSELICICPTAIITHKGFNTKSSDRMESLKKIIFEIIEEYF